MKSTVCRLDLVNALSIAYKAISTKSPLPIQMHFLIEAKNGRLKISATDSAFGIETTISAQDVEEGAFTTPAKEFADTVNLLDDEYIMLSKTKENFEIHGQGFSNRLMTLDSDDFPIIPHFDDEPNFIIQQKDLKRAINNVAFSKASMEETRAILTGVCINVAGDVADFAASDSRRLAVTSVPVQSVSLENRSYVVPGKTLDEIEKFVKYNDEPVFVGIKNSLIFFQIGDIFITSRLIEGKYPNFKQIIPAESKYSIRVLKDAFASGIRVVIVVAQEKNFPNLIKLNITKDLIVIRANTPDLGGSSKEVSCVTTGDIDLNVAFNGKFFLDILSKMSSDEIILEMTDNESPCVVKSTSDETHICVVMPIKLN